MQSRNRGWMVLALFFGSGATALVYEVVWSKFLAQMFGSTIYAQTVVMAAFMGGLALGNRIFGRWADRASHPVRAYGLLEIAIGIYALLFYTLDRVADAVFVALGSHVIGHSGVLLTLKGILSVALLLGPTILMGGTLPLLAAWLQHSTADAGRGSARFYSVNSLGAVAGSALAGFWLVQRYGLVATLQITAVANLIVGSLAVLVGGTPVTAGTTAGATGHGGSGVSEPAAQGPALSSLRWAGLIVALTGGVSMGLEVLSARSLALIFGSSLQTFAVVLIAFILGIGLGSAWIASPRRGSSAERIVVALLCIAGAWVSILVFNIEKWVDFYRIAHTGLARTTAGYVFHQLLAGGMSVVILGVPAALIGAVLPLMIRAVAREGSLLGARVGALLTWNTLGAVAGTLFTGFVLMPAVGLRNAFAVLALVLGFVALVIALRRFWLAGMGGALVACGLAVALFVAGGEGWRNVMSSGVFRIRETQFQPQLMAMRKAHMKILFYEDAPDATVTVEQVDGVIAPSSIGLRINGKPDAGTWLDMGTQYLVSHLPMMVKPDAKDVFVLGIGSGITAGAVLDYPVKHIDVAENCEPVIRAARTLFGPWNNHVLDSPRTTTWCEDARTVLKLRTNKYDVIITVPSNPWTAGIGSVFTREYYELAASRLKPDGIVAQWFQVYETQDDIVELVLRTFGSVFPYMEIWDSGSDIILLGAKHPWKTGPEVFRQAFANERVRKDMWMIDLHSPEALLAKQVASQRTAFAIPGSGPIQSDLFPILEYSAPRAFYIGSGTRFLEAYDERTRQQLLAPPEKRVALQSLPVVSVQLVFNSFSTINGELYGCAFGTSLGTGVPCIFQTPTPAPAPDSDGSPLSDATKDFAAGDLDKAAELVSSVLQRKPDDLQAGYLARVIARQQELRDGKSVAAR